MNVTTVLLDNKGRFTVPVSVRKKFRGREWIVVEQAETVEIVPKSTLRKLFGLSPKLTIEGLRNEKDRFI